MPHFGAQSHYPCRKFQSFSYSINQLINQLLVYMTADLHQKIENIISLNEQADDREIVFQLTRNL